VSLNHHAIQYYMDNEPMIMFPMYTRTAHEL